MKLLVFLLIVAAIWYGMRWFRQVDAIRRDRLRTDEGANPFARPRTQERTMPRATETILCSRCGAYVPADVTSPCGRTGCPFLAPR